MELSYVQKGQKVELKAESSESIYLDHRNFLIEYMELPISAKVSITRKPKIDFYLTGGINLSYWIGGKVDVDVYADMLDTNPYQYSETWPIKFESSASGPAGDTFYITNRFDIGIHVGFGTFLFNRFFIDARYVIGLSEIEFFKGANAGNRVVQFSIGLPIKLKVSKQ